MNGYLVVSVACGLALFGFICYLVGSRRGYTLRDNELNDIARNQDWGPSPDGAAVTVVMKQATFTPRPAAPALFDDDIERIASLVAAKVGAYTPPVGHDDLPDEILRRTLYRLPRPVGHRGEVIEADVLEWTGRHSVAVQQGLALQRALTASTAEYDVVATTEPELWCLAGLDEPVAAEDWGYPGLGKELAVAR